MHMTSKAGVHRVLVLRGGAIGDFVLTLPALAAIRRTWPEARMELAGYPHIAQLAVAGQLADRVLSLDNVEFARLFSRDARFADEQVRYFRSFDLIISYLHDPDTIVQKNLKAAGACRVLCASPQVQDRHAIDTLLAPLEELGINQAGAFSRLALKEQHLRNGRQRAKKFGKRIIAIHPGSGSPKKNWPFERFVTLAEKLAAETEFKPVFTVGEADSAVAGELTRIRCPAPVLPQCSLVELAEFLSACAGYVSNDSGITHLAAALGIPVVALFGPSDPARWAPRGPNARVLHDAGGLAGISAGTVLETLLGLVQGRESL